MYIGSGEPVLGYQLLKAPRRKKKSMHLGAAPYWALVCATLATARPLPRRAGRRRYAPRAPANDPPTKPPAEDDQYACSAPDATPAQEPKFCLVYGHDAGYGSRFESFDAAREAWAARHNVTVLRNAFRPTSRYITYQKIEIVSRAIANPNCTHFMWQDSDLHVCRPDFSPSRWIANDPHLVLVDHAVSLNNGAFIMKRGPCMNAFVRNWHEWNSRRAFPFTDNGSMLAAILDFFFGDRRCVGAKFDGHGGYMRCVHARLDAHLGPKNKATRRFGGLELLYPPDGFNSHACTTKTGPELSRDFISCEETHQVKQYSWTATDMFVPGMFAMHTKLAHLPCPAFSHDGANGSAVL